MRRRRLPARSMKAASSAMPCRTLSGGGVRQPRPPRGMRGRRRRPRPRPSPPAGTRTSSSIRASTGPSAILHPERVQDREPDRARPDPGGRLLDLFRGYGWEPLLVSGGFDGEESGRVHERFAAALDEALDNIEAIQGAARENGTNAAARWPMLILRTPKGWTGPREVDGKPVEGTWRSHQVRSPVFATAPSASGSSRSGYGATGPTSCSTMTGDSSRRSGLSRPTGTRG